jgi:predicted DNA-binding transcriptional regulator AlpA
MLERSATDSFTVASERDDKTQAKCRYLPSSGLLRIASIIGPSGPIPVSRSTWWAGVKSGRYPQPVKLGPRITTWRVEDIQALIESGSDA